MNSLNAFLSDLSSRLGVELVYEENKSDRTSPYSIRFVGLDLNKSFRFVISRSWKTTLIRFQADAFAGDFVEFICGQISINSLRIGAEIESNQQYYSSIIFEIDGKPFFVNENQISENSTFTFEVEVLTPESSIEYGLLNKQEYELFNFAISLIASVLPIKSVTFRNPDEVLGFPEGAVSKVLVNKYERDPRNRREAIAIHGKSCLVCGFNFEEMYGELGDDYIVVHHLVPISQMESDYLVDPATDLVTLCANCHAMIHRNEPPLSIAELRKIISD
jgi:5-methylcytosine-specific restriction protein A